MSQNLKKEAVSTNDPDYYSDNTQKSSANDSGILSDTSFEDKADWISKLFLLWLDPLLKLGAKRRKEGKHLEYEDAGPTSHQDRCHYVYLKFSQFWNEEKEDKTGNIETISLWNPLMKSVGRCKFALAFFYYGIAAITSFGPILILNILVRHFSGQETISNEMLWILVSCLLVLPIIGAVASVQATIIQTHVGSQIRNALINGMVYDVIDVQHPLLMSFFELLVILT
jgi:hypothetical protein